MLRNRCPQHSPSPARPTTPRPHERAQATIEFVGTLPLLALAATVCLQALLVALALVFAQSAADRAATGASPERVLASIPSGWRQRATLDTRDARATVRIEPPSVLPGAASRLAVRASSEVPR